jgi:hypothetical protein
VGVLRTVLYQVPFTGNGAIMPVLAQERRTHGRSLGQNWHYGDLAGITPIMTLIFLNVGWSEGVEPGV